MCRKCGKCVLYLFVFRSWVITLDQHVGESITERRPGFLHVFRAVGETGGIVPFRPSSLPLSLSSSFAAFYSGRVRANQKSKGEGNLGGCPCADRALLPTVAAWQQQEHHPRHPQRTPRARPATAQLGIDGLFTEPPPRFYDVPSCYLWPLLRDAAHR